MSRITDALAQGTTRYFQPPPRITAFGADNEPETGMNARLAMLVGLVALGLPAVMLLTPLAGGCLRDSISHHYYDPLFGPVFVGMLSFIGGFLIAYRGENWAENYGASLAGLGAFGVAVWPTTGHGCEAIAGVTSRVFVVANPDGNLELVPDRDPFSLFSGVADLHVMSAAIVFGFLGLFVLVVLRRVVPDRHMVDGEIIPTKRARNILYSLTGATILLCIAVLGLKSMAGAEFLARWDRMNLTFWIEALALWAFALAWLAKGRVFAALNDPV